MPPVENLSFSEWPVPEAQYEKFFLSNDAKLAAKSPPSGATISFLGDVPAIQMGNDPEEVVTWGSFEGKSSRHRSNSLKAAPTPPRSHKGSKLPPGKIVRLDIPIWVAAIEFDAGEKLVVKISGHEMRLAEFEPLRGRFLTGNKERQVVHFGGEFDSHVEIPLVPIS
ncbi:hypothetical protein Forpi1262_v013246 [Fusarium oxysporum f. sp. raphani]|uniref:Xaa-Pro dipeptidyl-peptidase C-terminal domain-containing protein n=1 Tax=Fusarium oxysporum f. sp. raphani TaxID=96318 RepID=A0A8J5PMW3_FUSOX|nr:hypothetical protein Forpi1262_v013246 [Fusarium oxysporum f. sp. raphani]